METGGQVRDVNGTLIRPGAIATFLDVHETVIQPGETHLIYFDKM